MLRATDGQGHILEGILQVQILPLLLELDLRDITQVSLFAGETRIRLPLAGLLQGDADPQELSWEISGAHPASATYDPVENALILQTESPWPASQIVTLKVRDPDDREAEGQILVQVYPADGSAGATSPDFRLIIVPNVFQPDFLDVFVLSDIPLFRPPLLRVEDDTWRDVSLEKNTSGIWHGTHTLQPGQEGLIEFLALALDQDQQAFKTALSLTVGTAQPFSAKRLSAAQASVYFPAHSFGEAAVVALIPAATPDPGPELVPLSSAYTIHSPQTYQGREGRISVPMPITPLADRAALYWWDPGTGQWAFAGAEPDQGQVQAPLERLGLYALMADLTPPQLQASEEEDHQWRLSFSDQGSGISAFHVTLDQHPMPASAYTWDGEWLTVPLPPGTHHISVQVADQAGNQAPAVAKTTTGRAIPQTFQLGQNFPNPFNPSTTIPLFVPASARVRLDIYSAGGQRVRMLLDQVLPPGSHELTWDARDDRGQPVSSGLYLYCLQIDDQARTRKMTLLR